MENKFFSYNVAKLLSEKTGKNTSESENFLSELSMLFNEGIMNDNFVKIRGIGVYKVVLVKERESIHVNTGERIVIPPHHKLSFTPEKKMRDMINKPFALFEAIETLEDGGIGEIAEIGEIGEVEEIGETNNNYELRITNYETEEAGNISTSLKDQEEIGEIGDRLLPPPIAQPPIEEMPIPQLFIPPVEEKPLPPPFIPPIEEKPIPQLFIPPIEERPIPPPPPPRLPVEEKPIPQSFIPPIEERPLPPTPPRPPIEEKPQNMSAHSSSSKTSSHNTKKHKKSKRSSTTYLLWILFVLLFVLVVGALYYFFFYNRDTFNSMYNTRISVNEEIVIPDETIMSDEISNEANTVIDTSTLVNSEVSAIDTTTLSTAPVSEPVAVATTPRQEPATRPQTTTSPQTTASSTNNNNVLATVRMQQGQRLTLIAEQYYGHKVFWVYIYEYNKAKIGSNPNLIPTGMEILVPAKELYDINANSAASVKKATDMQTQIMEGLY